MKCPVDGTELSMSERQGIEVDYCPQCRGVWLDRGELDKIIDRSASEVPMSSQAQQPVAETRYREEPPRYRDEPRRYDDDRYHQGQHGRPYKKRKSFLGEIFDFD